LTLTLGLILMFRLLSLNTIRFRPASKITSKIK
jgi:hypothetical protein